MDTKRIYTNEYIERFRQIFKLKYENLKFDVIITTDDNALKFVANYHKEIFAEAPTIFCGINDYDQSIFRGSKKFTGLVEVLDIKPTIDLALTLHPNTQNVIVLVDNTPTGLGQRKEVAAVVRQYENLKFEYLKSEDYSNDELFKKLQNLPSDSIILLTVWLRDKNNTYLPTIEGGALISSNSIAPVYGIIDMYMGHGIVGGKLLNSKTHGKIAAEIALRILNGESPSDIPVFLKSTNPYMFDYQQLDRWGISLSALPEGSVVINKPFSVYNEYKFLIWGVIVIIILLILFITFLTINIQYRKIIEKKLRENEAFLGTIFENIPNMIFVKDAKSLRFVRFNKAGEDLLGHSRKELIGKNDYDFFPKEEADFFTEKDRNVLSNGEQLDILEETIQTKHKGEKILHTKKLPIWGENGKPIYLLGISEDITDRKQAQETLKKSEERYRMLFNNTLDALFVYEQKRDEKDIKFIEVNDIACQTYGYTREELLEFTPIDLATPEKKEDARMWVREIFSEGHSVFEIVHKSKDGRKIPVEVSAHLFDFHGQPTVLSIVRDVTERKLAEEERLVFEAQLQHSHKMESIGTLAGGIAHDFNNMLGVISGNVSFLLNRYKEDADLVEVLMDIEEGTLKSQQLTQQLLTFAKGGAPIKKLADISHIIKESAKFVTRGAKAKCHFDLAPDLWATEVDPGQLNQVIINLVINANQSMPDGGNITIRAENTTIDKNIPIPLSAGRYIKIIVEDQGIGISEKHLSNIFDPYFSTKQAGSGLGLATTYSIIKHHDGHITVESELDKGTTFTIYLPASSKKLETIQSKGLQIHSGQGKILVMDDEASILKVSKRILSSMGYEVVFAKDGSEAIELYKNNFSTNTPFDLTILDLTIPGSMGGAETIPEILKIDPEAKVIVSSGYSSDPIMANYEKYGFCGVISKPYRRDQMAELLNKILNENE